jgi:hypothetical protein
MTTAIDARTVQREEAMRRLKALRLHENVVRDFASGKLNLSERAVFPGNRKKPFGILYWLNEGEKRAVEEFEAEYKAVVYHVMKYNTEFGTQYAMLYVSKSVESRTTRRLCVELPLCTALRETSRQAWHINARSRRRRAISRRRKRPIPKRLSCPNTPIRKK